MSNFCNCRPLTSMIAGASFSQALLLGLLNAGEPQILANLFAREIGRGVLCKRITD